MMIRWFTPPLVATCLLCLLACTPFALAADRPNVVLVLTDDQGWWDLGINGNPAIETPNMDRLASQGVYFTRFYASPVCAPTRASLMTGRYSQRTGTVDTYKGLDTLDAREITLAQIFQQAGYHTGIFGKWHLGRYMKYHPLNRGFDEFLGFWQFGFINHYDNPDELFRNREPVTAYGYITDVLTDAAIDFVRRSKDKPFFLYLPYNAPHFPYLVPDDCIAKYLKKGLPLSQARVYGMVDRIDVNLGRLLGTLDELKLADNTVVLFLSDNGGVTDYYTAGLRGMKGSVYEGGIRSPLFARWPGRFPAGARVSALTQHIDLLPTFCDLLGVKPPADRTIDGRSILPLMKNGGGDSPHEYLYHQWCRVRPSDQKDWAIHSRDYKLVNGELYDLQADPGEKHNLAAGKPQVVAQLRTEFERWFADVTAGRDYKPVPIEVGRADENPVEIDITWAEPVGKKIMPTYRSYVRDYVANWSDTSEFIRWKIDVATAGRYEVAASYGCANGQEGSRFRVQTGDVHCDGVVKATGSDDIYCSPAVVGTLDLQQGPATLECRALSIAGKELMALHKLSLRRLDASDE